MSLTMEQQACLAQEGYILLKGVLTRGAIDQLALRLEALWQAEGEQAGAENYVEPGTRRLANLANKGEGFRALITHPLILAAVKAVVGPDIRLSMLNARDVLPYAGQDQPLHCDTDSSEKPGAAGYTACTVIWMLDDFTLQNGATRLVPGSHRSGQTPKEAGIDPRAPHPAEVVLEGQAGDALVFNGHCWHAGGRNQTGTSRRAILAHYRRGDVLLRENRRQQLAPDVIACLTVAERALLDVEPARV